jgi:hypothetical protein
MLRAVIAEHSRPQDGVASLAYVLAISLRCAQRLDSRDGRDKPGHDNKLGSASGPVRFPDSHTAGKR